MRCISKVEGQASVEACLLIPLIMSLIGLLLQPICFLYTRCAMKQAAAEAVRIACTNKSSAEIKAFVERRLEVVPDISIFKNSDFKIDVCAGEDIAHVEISVFIKPVPVVGIVGDLFMDKDDRGFLVEADCIGSIKPEGLEGDYDLWYEMWR